MGSDDGKNTGEHEALPTGLDFAQTELPSEPAAPAPMAAGTKIDDTALAQTAMPAELAKTRSMGASAGLAAGELPEISRSRYVIQRELARGGMGRILSAQDQQLGRPVAIKELIKTTPGTRARFEREARITAQLQHPAIVPLYEAGRWPDGEPFFAMKMVAGAALDTVVAKCASPEERMALLPRIIDVADALAYAHSRGVIHRDLKPANVLIGDYGETVVIDWGLAREDGSNDDALDSLEDEIRQETADLTVLGQAMGTPAYMPPEQARGEHVDKQADVYALGAMLYHVLGGKMAYADSSSAQEVLDKVLSGPPEPLGTSDPNLPPALITIVSKAMARRKEDRYPDASVLADELRRFEAGKLVTAHNYSTRELVGRWVRKHRALVVTTSLMLAVLVGFGVWSMQRLRIERDQAMMARESAIEARASAMAERQEAVGKSIALALTLAAGLPAETPREALNALARLEGLEDRPDLTQQARMLAAEARTRRIPKSLTAPGSDHRHLALAPNNRLAAIGWHDMQVALLNLDDGKIQYLPGTPTDNRGLSHIEFSPDGKIVVAVKYSSEFTYLWETANVEQPRTIKLGTGASLARISPSGRWLAVERRHRVELYDLSLAGDLADTGYTVPVRGVRDLAFSPDGSTLAIAGNHAALLDLTTGKLTTLLEGQPDSAIDGQLLSFRKIAFSPTGDSLVFADDRVFHVQTGEQSVRKLFKATDSVNAIAFSSDGKVVAAGSDDTIIYVHRLDYEKATLHSLPGHNKPVTWLAFADNDQALLSGAKRGQLLSWQLGWVKDMLWSNGSEAISDKLGTTKPKLSSDGQSILAYTRYKDLVLWEREHIDLVPLGAFEKFSRALFAIASDDIAWTGGGRDFQIHLRSPDGGDRIVGNLGEQVEVLAISKDSRFVASGGGALLRLWDTRQGTSAELKGHASIMRHASFVGGRLITSDLNGVIYQWHPESGTGHKVSEHGAKLASYVATVVDPRGRWVATYGTDRKLYLHDLNSGDRRLLSGDSMITGMAASPDGEWIAFSPTASTIRVLSTVAESEPIILNSPTEMERLSHPTFSPDGSAIAASNNTTGIRLWEYWNTAPTTRLLRGAGPPDLPAFSPDGQRIIATGDTPMAVSIWHVASGQRRDIPSHITTMHSAFWPEGQAMLVETMGGQVQLWRDELPTTWPELHSWVETQVRNYSLAPGSSR